MIFGLEMGFPAFEKEKNISKAGKTISRLQNCGNNVKIAQKLCGKFHFRIRKCSTKFHIKLKVTKPHFKLRKALFKRGLERNCENKNVLEFDVEKFFFLNSDNFELCRLLCDGEL